VHAPSVPAPAPVPGPAPLRLAITGTDTGVGKTMVTCALLAALRARGLAVPGMKPVETGIVERHAGTDAARLRRAAGDAHHADDVCPVTYEEPLAPLVAAERSGRPVELARLDAAFARLAAGADGIVVEGAGGITVPFTRGVDLAALAGRWTLDLVVVAADRLGVLNHAMLTVREAERRGLRVRAVVLNAVRPAPADVAEATNLGALRSLLAGVPVLPFAYVPPERQDDLAHLAALGGPLAALLAGEGAA
jgi:dethiobiotin synthetase